MQIRDFLTPPPIYLILNSQSLNLDREYIFAKEGGLIEMKSSIKKFVVIGIIVLFVISIIAGILGGHL
jgi:hypothetical protein